MARDSSLYARRAIISALKADTDVAAMVAARVYGPNPPADPIWPFVRYGLPTAVPKLASGIDGATLAITIHGFAKGEDETAAVELGAALASALDDKTMVLDAPYLASLNLRWTATQTIHDSEEATGWHVIVQFTARVTS